MDREALKEEIILILNKVYTHGTKRSIEVLNVPDEEMTIANGLKAITNLAEQYAAKKAIEAVEKFADLMSYNLNNEEIISAINKATDNEN